MQPPSLSFTMQCEGGLESPYCIVGVIFFLPSHLICVGIMGKSKATYLFLAKTKGAMQSKDDNMASYAYSSSRQKTRVREDLMHTSLQTRLMNKYLLMSKPHSINVVKMYIPKINIRVLKKSQ